MQARKCVAFNPARLSWIGLLILVFLSQPILASTTNDHFLLGYVTAILERQYKLKTGSLKVQEGVVLINASDLPASDQDKIVTTLKEIAGVVRVETVEIKD